MNTVITGLFNIVQTDRIPSGPGSDFFQQPDQGESNTQADGAGQENFEKLGHKVLRG